VAFFPYDFDDRYKLLWSLFGAKPDRDGVELTADDRFVATYGRKTVDTPLDNIDGAHITRNYTWFKAVGIRGSLADDGLTLGTTTEGGVCVHFHDRVRRQIGFRDHSAVTVTVEDLQGLVAALEAATGNHFDPATGSPLP
jgi:hypothetical protein